MLWREGTFANQGYFVRYVHLANLELSSANSFSLEEITNCPFRKELSSLLTEHGYLTIIAAH